MRVAHVTCDGCGKHIPDEQNRGRYPKLTVSYLEIHSPAMAVPMTFSDFCLDCSMKIGSIVDKRKEKT